tara:strand:+ start:441 stop:1103 length:663 start_codon:yes stop_codon:yes gene_type:complete
METKEINRQYMHKQLSLIKIINNKFYKQFQNAMIVLKNKLREKNLSGLQYKNPEYINEIKTTLHFINKKNINLASQICLQCNCSFENQKNKDYIYKSLVKIAEIKSALKYQKMPPKHFSAKECDCFCNKMSKILVHYLMTNLINCDEINYDENYDTDIEDMGYEYCGESDSDKNDDCLWFTRRYDCYSSDDSDSDIYTTFHRNRYSMLDNSSIENSSDSE